MDAIFILRFSSSAPLQRKRESELRLVSYKSYARFVSMALATHTLHTHGQREGLPFMTSAKFLAFGFLPLSTFWT